MVGIDVYSAISLGGAVLFYLYRRFKYNQTISLTSKWVVITGCDSGFGLMAVKELWAKQAAVIALCLTPKGLEAAREAGAKHAILCDLSKDSDIVHAASEIKRISAGRLWAVVHNAGSVKCGFIDFQPISGYRENMEVNLFGPVRLNQLLMPLVKKNFAGKGSDGGRVVILTSVCGIVNLSGHAAYSTSKFALEAFAASLRIESTPWNIHVAVVSPAIMKTPLLDKHTEGMRGAWSEMSRIDPDGDWRKAWTAEWLEGTIADNERAFAMGEDPAIAVADICHAVAAANPKIRYLSGPGASILFYALWCMPESWAFRAASALWTNKPAAV